MVGIITSVDENSAKLQNVTSLHDRRLPHPCMLPPAAVPSLVSPCARSISELTAKAKAAKVESEGRLQMADRLREDRASAHQLRTRRHARAATEKRARNAGEAAGTAGGGQGEGG